MLKGSYYVNFPKQTRKPSADKEAVLNTKSRQRDAKPQLHRAGDAEPQNYNTTPYRTIQHNKETPFIVQVFNLHLYNKLEDV